MAGGEIAVSAVQTTRREHVQTISWLTMSDQDPQAALDEFRRLVEDEEDLYIGTPPDERILMLYLRCTDNNAEEAFEKMKTVYRTKEMYRDFFAVRRDPEVHDVILGLGSHQVLPHRDQLGRRIYLLRMSKFDLSTFRPCQMCQVDDLWFSVVVNEEETQENGLVILVDFERVPWGILRMFSPFNSKAMTAKTEIVPFKHVQIHIVNAGFVLNAIVRITYPFLSQATKDSIFVHKSLESLHEHVSPSALPREYGGERPSVDTAKLVRDYLDPNNDRLSEVLSYGYRSRTKSTIEQEN